MTQLWEISWGPAIKAPYPEVLETTYPYRSTKVTLEYIKAKPQVNVVTRRVETRTLELDATQVEGIVRLWARAHAVRPHVPDRRDEPDVRRHRYTC